MGLELVTSGKNLPEEINVVIEIPKDSEPVKYEVDKASGAIFVDRILSTPMRYPATMATCPTPCAAMATRPTCWWCCRCHWCQARWCAAVRWACCA